MVTVTSAFIYNICNEKQQEINAYYKVKHGITIAKLDGCDTKKLPIPITGLSSVSTPAKASKPSLALH